MTVPHTSLRNLVRDERGNVMMTLGLTSFIAVACIGGAVDFGRAHQQKSRLQNALDAAVVSGVSKLKDTGNFAAAQSHAMAVFQGVYSNAVQKTTANPNPTAGLDQPIVQFTQTGTQIVAQASVTANTPFMKFVIGHDLQVNADSSAVPPSGKMLEVALMVDVTGSMGWNAASGAAATTCSTVSNPVSKLDYLKCAGEDLLNILLPTSGVNNSSVKIGVAPFADYVNAGVYAEKVVDPVAYPPTGGTYANVSNLASTRQGAFSGSYSGGSSGGSGFGATGASVPSGGTSAAGATFSNSYCSNPTYPATGSQPGTFATGITLAQRSADGEYPYWGLPVTVTGTKPTSVLEGNSEVRTSSGAPSSTSTRREGDRLQTLTWVDNEGTSNDYWWWYDLDGRLGTGSYYVPLVTSAGSLTKKMKDGSPVGVRVNRSGGWDKAVPSGMQKNSTGYWKVSAWNGTDWDYTWVGAPTSSTNRDFFVPLHDGLETGYVPASPSGTYPQCTSTVASQPSSHLISCVTERKNYSDLDYTADAIAANRYVGPYNHGSTSKSNYSSDGKCWVGGRELPAVIPLTNNRSTVASFFSNATAGGATPGHLGTAWASYLLSPTWSNIWPSDSTPAAYTNTGVVKSAILMTDGQYNLQFSTGSSSSNISAKQALMLCKEMRSKGIKVYTVGFGFAANAQPPTTNIEAMSDSERTTPLASGTDTQKALDTLAKCASSNSSYYFPYDGEALRTVFKNIASSLSADLNGGKARLTN